VYGGRGSGPSCTDSAGHAGWEALSQRPGQSCVACILLGWLGRREGACRECGSCVDAAVQQQSSATGLRVTSVPSLWWSSQQVSFENANGTSSGSVVKLGRQLCFNIAPTTLVGAYEWTSWAQEGCVCVRVGVGPYTGPFGALHPLKALKRNICIVLKVIPSPCTKRARGRSTSWKCKPCKNCISPSGHAKAPGTLYERKALNAS